MFLVSAGTTIQIQVPPSIRHFCWSGWRPYQTREDKIYDKHEVWDLISVHNAQMDIPEWARRNIVEHGYTVLKREGKYALVRPERVKFID